MENHEILVQAATGKTDQRKSVLFFPYVYEIWYDSMFEYSANAHEPRDTGKGTLRWVAFPKAGEYLSYIFLVVIRAFAGSTDELEEGLGIILLRFWDSSVAVADKKTIRGIIKNPLRCRCFITLSFLKKIYFCAFAFRRFFCRAIK